MDHIIWPISYEESRKLKEIFSSNEDDKENKDEEIEEFSTDNKLPVPNFSMPNFPPGFAANLPHNLPNFDPSNLPQGVRELAMLQHQQMAQVWFINLEIQNTYDSNPIIKIIKINNYD